MKNFLSGKQKSRNIGFISTRLAGTDGVSLETAKWASVLEKEGFSCFYLAGELDRSPDKSLLVPQAHFTHSDIREIYQGCFTSSIRDVSITRKIQTIKDKLKKELYFFIEKFSLDMLIPQNVLALPLNIPLGLALTEVISETGISTIAHHHDFFWERKRFLVNGVWDYLNMAFPPHLPFVQHVVINSSADNQLSLRTGISSTIIPNVMDFDNPPLPPDDYSADVRKSLGLTDDELFVLQPTRVVKRKGIEHAIELISRLSVKGKLVISHASGDEGNDYQERVRQYSSLLGVDTLFVSDIIDERRSREKDGRKIYTLYDIYPHADLVTYPSTREGFGNAFLEAIYFRKPIVVNNYSIFATDIKPKGFRTIELDDYVTDKAVQLTQEVLKNPDLAREMAEHNYALGKRFYSYRVLRQKLMTLILDCFGSACN